MEHATTKPHIYKRNGIWGVRIYSINTPATLKLAAVRYVDKLNKAMRDKQTPMVFNWIEPLNW